MKTLVLDTNELRRDWLLTGFTARLLGYSTFHTVLNVCVPAPALEELVALHAREVREVILRTEKVSNERRRLGLVAASPDDSVLDYRAYLLERFDEILSFDVLPWPEVSHRLLVERATSRTPPFDSKGGGYRDSLVWASVLELAKAGSDVVLVTADGTFSGPEGQLAPALQSEADSVPGRVELVRELVPWLLQNLPWKAASLEQAVSRAQDEEFFAYLSQSDMMTELTPEASAIGFERAPLGFEVDETEWTGLADRVGTRAGADGLLLAEYDVGQTVSFIADLPESTRLEDGWEMTWSRSGRVRVEGQIELVVRIAVLFDEDLSMSVEELDWRRADGLPGGPGLSPPLPNTPLF